jgi:hypothetical protein
VFGIRRRAKSHAQLVREELGESFEHLIQAATHMAGGVGATVGPRVNAAREYMSPAAGRMRNRASHGWESTVATFAPIAAAARDGARQGRGTTRKVKARNLKAIGKKESRMSRKRWPMLAGLLTAGAAVGAAGALVMRRRRQQQWQEYGSESGASTKGPISRTAESLASGVQAAAGKVSTAAQTAADKTSSFAGSTADRTTSAIDATKSKAQQSETAAKADDLISRAGTGYNSRS